MEKERTELQRAAMEYCQLGYAIFPIQKKAKIPLTKNGVKDASSDPAVVQGWWEKWPEANIGLATGSINKLLVIDLDIDEDKCINGYDSLKDWQRDHGTLPDTCMSITGRGGYHWFYKTTEHFKNRVGILPGIDIRSDGGYIVAPPSLHPNGRKYEWEESFTDTPIAEVNDLIRLLLDTGKEITPAKQVVMPDKVVQGKRNDTMFKLACSLQSKGLSDEAMLLACKSENEAKFKPPLPEDELKAIIKNVCERFQKGDHIYFDATGNAYAGQHEPNLETDAKNRPLQTIANAKEAITFDKGLYGKVFLNTLAYAPFIRGSVPWEQNDSLYREWNNYDDSALKMYIEQKYGIKSMEKIMEALNNVVKENEINPVKDLLYSAWKTHWDKKSGHIRSLLPTYLGAEDTEYTYEVMKVFMLGAISRIMQPGCKFDYMMILVGPQGVGKSAFLRFLSMGNEWYNDNFNTIDGDKATEKLRGMWMVEFAELLATKRQKDVEGIKAFITSTIDTYRPPYGRRTEQRPRTCVFAGTTNDYFFLSDTTGNRRFLPIMIHTELIKKRPMDYQEDLSADVMQAWGEAMELYMKANGMPRLILSNSAQKVAEALQKKHSEEDPRVGIIQEYLDRQPAEVKRICVPQIMVEALGYRKEDCTKSVTKQFHNIMRTQIDGWIPVEKRIRVGEWGPQYPYDKKNEARLVEVSDDPELPF